MVATLATATDIAYAPPVGGMTLPAAASTDTFVSAPLARSSVWVGTAASVSGNDITVSGTPNWTTNGFTAPGYYVRMLNGAQKGHYFTVTANASSAVTVDSAGLDLSTIIAGDPMEIVPYWTLGTLYPPSLAGFAFTASASPAVRQTTLLFFDATSTGINRSASATYYFYNGAWRQVGKPATTSYSSTIIYPDSYFLQRNTASATSLVVTGRVQPGYLGTILVANTGQNDNFVALSYPVDVTLDGTGLATAAFQASASPAVPKDQLYWYDPAVTGINKSATYTYYYYNGAWRRKGSPATTNFGSTVLKAGSGFIIRKAAGGSSASWIFGTGI